LLLILLFNAVGYRLLLHYWEGRANEQLIARLDEKAYNEADLIELSAPLNLPWFTNWQHFERCDGQITINGTVYNYVARKYVNNVMIYKCIPNRAVQHILTTQKQVDQLAWGDPATNPPGHNKSPLSSYFKSLAEYDNVMAGYMLSPLTEKESTRHPWLTESLYNVNPPTLYQPPEQGIYSMI
jgi:hypothetical protein